MKTHNDVIREVSNEGWNFNQRFIRSITYPNGVYDYYGNKTDENCSYCDRGFDAVACERFEDEVRRVLRREVIEPYMEKHCPDCEQKIEDMTVVQEADPDSFGEAAFNPDIDAEEAFKIAREEKRRYEPCGCLHQIGEEEMLWDLNKEKVEEEVSFYGYNGDVFNG